MKRLQQRQKWEELVKIRLQTASSLAVQKGQPERLSQSAALSFVQIRSGVSLSPGGCVWCMFACVYVHPVPSHRIPGASNRGLKRIP